MNDRDQVNLWEESEVEKGKQALRIRRSGELQGENQDRILDSVTT